MNKKKVTQEEIAKAVSKAHELGIGYKEAAERFGIPVWKIYHYNCKRNKKTQDSNSDKQEPGYSGFADPIEPEGNAKQPVLSEPLQDSQPNELPSEVRNIIVQYRKEHPDHGFKRIEQHLQNRHFLVIPRKKIRQALKNAGLLDQLDSSFDKNKAAAEPERDRRFEAAKPGELYQMDVTYIYIEGIKVLYLINLIDDHSRFCLSSSLQFDQSADTLIEVLHRAIEMYGKPDKLLTDQGPSFYTWSFQKTKFQAYLDDMQIEHIVTDPHHPTTTGKVERFHQTIKNELIRKVKFKSYADALEKIEAFVYYYNYERPHQSLNGQHPADRFMGVSVSKSLARNRLLTKDIHNGKGYLIYKFGCHEVCIIHEPDEEPKVIINGVCFHAQQAAQNAL